MSASSWVVCKQRLSDQLVRVLDQSLKLGRRSLKQSLELCVPCVCVFVCVLVAQPCPTLCDHMDCVLLGSSVCGILQARILEYVAIPFCRGSS